MAKAYTHIDGATLTPCSPVAARMERPRQSSTLGTSRPVVVSKVVVCASITPLNAPAWLRAVVFWAAELTLAGGVGGSGTGLAVLVIAALAGLEVFGCEWYRSFVAINEVPYTSFRVTDLK